MPSPRTSGTRVVTRAFEALGNEPAPAQRLAAWSTLAVMLGIEVLDGYSKRYSFSWEDAAMNVVGVGLGYLMERNRDARQPSRFPAALPEIGVEQLRSRGRLLRADLSPRRQGERRARPCSGNSVLRYFELAAGYGTRGYESPPGVERERNLYFGVSVNLSEVLAQTVFRGSKERGLAQRATDLFLEFVQVPGTAALASHRLQP